MGDFDRETGKFIPDERFIDGPALLDYGSNVFTGSSALVDPVSGDVYLFSIMQDQRGGAEEGAAGWAHCVGLPRKIWPVPRTLPSQSAPGRSGRQDRPRLCSGWRSKLKIYGKALDKETIVAQASFQAPEIAYEDIGLQNILTEDIYKTQFHGGPYQHFYRKSSVRPCIR